METGLNYAGPLSTMMVLGGVGSAYNVQRNGGPGVYSIQAHTASDNGTC